MRGDKGVTRVDDVTPAWMDAFLAGLGFAARVRSIAATPVGTGQVAHCVRFALEFADWDGRAPRSFVGKFPSPDPLSRQTGGLGAYVKEFTFYSEFKPTVGIRTPTVHRIEFDPATSDFMLMMEDMAPARQGDQVAGCSLAVAECAMDEIARLHAPRWGDPALLVHPLFAPRRSAGLQFEFYESLWQAFLGRYQDRLEPEVLAVGLALHDRYTTYARAYPGPSTLIHADFRLDNVLIGEESRRPTMAVVDWQTFTVGCSAHDVAYFLGAGLLRDDRRRHERELVRRYHEALRAGGVRDYSWDQLWHDYRWYSYSGYVMAVVASTIVVQTERGDEMFMTMAKRHAQQVLDLDAQAVLDAVT